MMNRFQLAALAVAFAAPCIAPAQQPDQSGGSALVIPADQQPTGGQIDRLFEVMRIKDQMAAMQKTMPVILQQQMKQQIDEMQKDHPELAQLTPAQQEASTRVIAKFMQQSMGLYSSDDMLADMKSIYQRHLTGNDAENLITFYNSTTGQHMLNMVPVIMQEFVPAAMQKMQGKMRPLIVEMSKELAQIRQSPAGASQDHATPDKQ